ncbi:MAG: phosphate/phosphite/phosphonate ABC transporter substrate-binding protein [Planctomycetota bacterium]
MTDAPNPAPAPSENTSPLRLLAVVIGLGIVGLLVYQLTLSSVGAPPATENLTMRTIGLTSPISNRLDPAFVDTNADLVADAPADEADRLDPDTLIFSFIATPQDAERYLTVFADFADHLTSKVGRTVEIQTFTSTDEQLLALRNGSLHITMFNTGSVPIAVNAAGFVPVAAPGTDAPQAYRMLIIAPPGSPVNQITDLRGRELTVTRPTSNSGFKAPLVLLFSDYSMKPNEDFLISHSWGHENSIRSVVAGDATAAAVASDLLDRMIAAGEVSSADFEVVYKSELFPSAAIGYSARLTADLKQALDAAIAEFDFTDTSVATEYPDSRANRFAPVSYKDDFALVRRIDDAIGFEHKLTTPAVAPIN